MTNSELEEIFNQTFSRLALYFRDTNLSQDLISKYSIGQILNERGFVDMTYKGGGLADNLRYLIASSNGRDFSIFQDEDSRYGHILLKSNTFFKVLDIYRIGMKTQIFLLEIPETAIGFFAESTTNMEEEIIVRARAIFDQQAVEKPLPELQSPEWKDRTADPIGMNDNGEFFM